MLVLEKSGSLRFTWAFLWYVSPLVGMGALMPPAYGASPLALEDVLRSVETAAEGIRSYEVYLTCTRHWTLKTVVVGTMMDGPLEAPILEWRQREPGEDPETEVFLYRQVLAPGGKRRIEQLDPQTEEPLRIVVSDGEVMRRMDKPKAAGSISSLVKAVEDGHDYLGYLGNPFASGSIVQMTRNRQSRVLVEDDSGKVAFEARPGGTSYASFGWRISLDPEHGLLPARIERYRHSMKRLYSRTEVNEFREVEPSVWAPVDVTIQFYDSKPERATFGEVAHVIHAVVDQERSRWNLPLSDDTFRLAFPGGTRVHDTVRKVTFVAGKGDTGKNLDDLMKNAKDVVPFHDAAELGQLGPPTGRWGTWRWILVGLSVGLLVALLLVMGRKRWRQSA